MTQLSNLSHLPAPGAAPVWRMLLAQAVMELRLTLRRGESLLLTMVIPVVLLVFLSTVDVLGTGGPEDDPAQIPFVVPGVLAVAVMSTAMTGLAIATGFERQYGVLKRLGASPLPRWALLGGKTLSVLAVEAIQCVTLVAVGLGMGWRPPDASAGAVGAAVALLLLGTLCFAGLGLLMAGTLRAEATLALANLLFVVLLLVGGGPFPLDRLPGWLESVGRFLPTAALADALRAVFDLGEAVGTRPILVLVGWTVAGLGAAAATFRWE